MREIIEARAVRIFVSSTFCDMQAERNELAKYTFPELRSRCREREVELTEVDLRWGVTEEQSNRGEVLPICLAEIERCRPYFICHLGERYGFVPEIIDDDLKEEHPWLKEHETKSYTALEIVHGVLNNPPMKPRSFFYFRDMQESARVEEELKKDSGYEEEPQELKHKLTALKADIRTFARHNGYPVHENYPDAKSFGEIVLDDLWCAIDKKFPEGSQPTKQERNRMDNEAFAEIRRKVYIGRDEYFKKLNDHVAGDGPPLVITGESGIGKSALISNWMERYRTDNPEDFMIARFIGGTADSADYVFLIRSIMLEIKDRYKEGKEDKSEELLSLAGENEDDIPADPKKVVEAFPAWLAKVSAMQAHKGKRFILILDGLNQLNDRDNAPALAWLPQYINPDTRLILSTLPGVGMDALTKREWPEYEVKLMNRAEREKFIINYLKQFTKGLGREHRELILEANQSANPLYIRTLLEELKLFGYHAKLTEKIEYYLKAKTVEELFAKVLARFEKDYDRDRNGLTREAMSFIWASRHGLTEEELLEMLGSDGEKLPQALWSPLYLAAEESLVNRSGLLNFFHDFMRKAVESRYLKLPENRQNIHLRIADYFEKRELDERKVSEFPWQLERAEKWGRLKDCIAEPGMFLRLSSDEKKYELTGYWLSIGGRFDMVDTYNLAIEKHGTEYDAMGRLTYLLNQIAGFLYLNAKYEGAEPIYRRVLLILEQSIDPDHPNVARALNNLALLLGETDRGKKAEPLLLSALEIFEKSHEADNPDMAVAFNNLALLYSATNRYKEAEPLYKKALEISEKSLGSDHPTAVTYLSNLAKLLRATNRYKEAELLFLRALEIDEKLFGSNHPNVAIRLNNLAELLRATDRHKEAEKLCRRALMIAEKSLGSYHPDVARVLDNLALLLCSTGRYKEAKPICLRALAIYEKSFPPVHSNVASALNNLAELLYSTGHYKKAAPLFRRTLAIYEKLFGSDHPSVAAALNNQAELLQVTDHYEEAEPLYQKALKISEKYFGPDHPTVATYLSNLAVLYNHTNRCGKAEQLFRRALAINEKSFDPNHSEVAIVLNNIAGLLSSTERYEESEPLFRRALAIFERSSGSDHFQVAGCLNNLATLMQATKRYEEAEPLFRRALEIFEKSSSSDHFQVAACLNNLATLMQATKRYEEAEALFRRALKIDGKSFGSDHSKVAYDLNNLAKLLHINKRYEEAEMLFRRALEIFEKTLGIVHPNVAVSLDNLAELLCATTRYEEAEPLLRRALKISENPSSHDHSNMATRLDHLAKLLSLTKRYEEAVPFLKRSLEIEEKSLSPDHPQVAVSLKNLAWMMYAAKRYKEAKPLFRRALEIYEKSFGPDDSRTKELKRIYEML